MSVLKLGTNYRIHVKFNFMILFPSFFFPQQQHLLGKILGIFENSFLAVYCSPHEKFAPAHLVLSVWEKDFRLHNIPEDDLK